LSQHQKWIRKLDKIVSDHVSGQPCLVCGSRSGTVPHHLLNRRHLSGRWDLDIVVPLCNEHHNTSNEIAAHSPNPEAQKAFDNWVKDLYPEKAQKVLDKRRDIWYGITINWETIHADLKAQFQE